MPTELDDYIRINRYSRLMCPHGGAVTIQTTTKQLNKFGAPYAKSTDSMTVQGCIFSIGGKPQPCTKVRWVTNSPQFPVDGVPGLVLGDVGLCKSSNNVVQGPAVVISV